VEYRPIGQRGGFNSPSPHHPACGSARGGSQRLPGRGWVVNAHPQLFDRQKPLILKPLVGHAGLGSQSTGTLPKSFPTKANGYGYTRMRAGLQEVTHTGAEPAPLFPVAHAHPSSQPVIDFGDWTIVLRDPEAVHPAAKIPGKLFHPVAHGEEPTSSGQSLDASFKFLKRRIRPPDSGSPEGKAKEVGIIGFGHPAFGLVDPEPEFALDWFGVSSGSGQANWLELDKTHLKLCPKTGLYGCF